MINAVETQYSNNGLFCMYAQTLLFKDGTGKGIQMRELNPNYKWYEVQRSYSIGLYVHKDRHMTVIL